MIGGCCWSGGYDFGVVHCVGGVWWFCSVRSLRWYALPFVQFVRRVGVFCGLFNSFEA